MVVVVVEVVVDIVLGVVLGVGANSDAIVVVGTVGTKDSSGLPAITIGCFLTKTGFACLVMLSLLVFCSSLLLPTLITEMLGSNRLSFGLSLIKSCTVVLTHLGVSVIESFV